MTPGMITSVNSRSTEGVVSMICKGFGGVGRLERGVAEAFDLGHHIAAHQRVVLDDEDGLGAALDVGGNRGFGGGLVQSRRARQVHLDRGAVAFLAVDLDVPARLLDEAEHHAQTKAGALADLLGGEEGIEHLFQVCGRDPGAGVAHGNHDIVADRDLAVHARVAFVEIDVVGLERELAAIRHGVARVQGKVEDRGGELVRIDQRRPGVLGEQRGDFDLLAQRRMQQFGGFEHQRVDVDLARLQRLFAGKGEQMLGQVGAAFGGLVDHLGDGYEFGAVGDGLLQDPDGAGDHGQDVVEVVRDAAGELADRVHLLACRNWASAARFSVRSRPMKKCRRTGSDHVPVQFSVTAWPSLWT